MTYSNPTHLYYPYPTTIPTFSPFYSSTVPSTYPTTIPNPTPTPTPNPSFPSYPHHLHDPSYHPPPSFTHPPYSSYPNSTASPSPNHYTSYTTSSTSDYGYSTHYNYPQHQPPHSYSQPASPNAEIVQRSCTEILEFIEEFRKEMKESFQDIQESFQEVSESLKSRAKNIQNVFSTLRRDLQEKIEKEKVEEHTAATPKKFVEGGDLQIIQEHQEKEEEPEISPNPKPSAPPMFPSTLLSPLKPLNLFIVHSAHSPPTLQLLLKELDRVPAPSLSTEPPPKPLDRCLITAILTFKVARDLNSTLPPLPPKPPDKTPTPMSTPKPPDKVLPLFMMPSPMPLLNHPLPRPPPKPNYHGSHSKLQPPSRWVRVALSLSITMNFVQFQRRNNCLQLLQIGHR
ncbi:unnamed protein product [Trifolium pratense]|uniref:Uncharacterized protein n=1 Tax=Trifolium pratense TaxID=57577 RepID=A0ACB0K4Z1_TRIPR|nr:unnamed protein product [Trifolium pratense]